MPQHAAPASHCLGIQPGGFNLLSRSAVPRDDHKFDACICGAVKYLGKTAFLEYEREKFSARRW